jgi:hypothetical protein
MGCSHPPCILGSWGVKRRRRWPHLFPLKIGHKIHRTCTISGQQRPLFPLSVWSFSLSSSLGFLSLFFSFLFLFFFFFDARPLFVFMSCSRLSGGRGTWTLSTCSRPFCRSVFMCSCLYVFREVFSSSFNPRPGFYWTLKISVLCLVFRVLPLLSYSCLPCCLVRLPYFLLLGMADGGVEGRC